MSTTKTRTISVVTLALGSMLWSAPVFATANSKSNDTEPEQKVTICHATDAQTNPYVKITVSANAIANRQDFNGHGVQHEGGVWFKGIADHAWGDIIPAFTTNGISYPGQNATAGAAILKNDCNIPAAVIVTEVPTDSHSGEPVHVVTNDDSDKSTPVQVNGTGAAAPAAQSTTPVVTELPHTGGVQAAFGIAGMLGMATYTFVRRLLK